MTPQTFTIRTDDDLRSMWTALMGPPGFASRTLWVAFLDENDVSTPLLMPIEDLPDRVEPRLLQPLHDLVVTTVRDCRLGGAVLLLSRPGPDTITAADRAWAQALHEALQDLPGRPIHLATDGGVRAFSPDDLLAA